MRGFRAVVLCSGLWGACLSDLMPDVGQLAESEQGDVGAGEREGGASNGASGGSDNEATAGGANGDHASGGNAGDGGASQGDLDGSMPANDASVDAGPPKPTGCNIKDSNPDKDVLFAAQVKPILASCGCHDPEDPDPQGVFDTGLVLTSYKSLRAGGDNTGAKIVVDGNPCDSIILKKLGESPPFGERMPLNGPYLTNAERALISDWIVEGARDN